jgi:hypothetical protein
MPVDGFEQDSLMDGEHDYELAGGEELEVVGSSTWSEHLTSHRSDLMTHGFI